MASNNKTSIPKQIAAHAHEEAKRTNILSAGMERILEELVGAAAGAGEGKGAGR